MIIINFNLLDFDPLSNFYTYEGNPFSGVAYEKLKNGGLTETMICNGRKNGMESEWYPSGQIKEYAQIINNHRHGIFWEWYENGMRKSDTIYEYGHKTKSTVWDENGVINERYLIDENSADYSTLQLLRKRYQTNFGGFFNC
jgi:antitoxin component YwqK of YwqJK toxin-antitoxin module